VRKTIRLPTSKLKRAEKGKEERRTPGVSGTTLLVLLDCRPVGL
jgi:hypothetical protein